MNRGCSDAPPSLFLSLLVFFFVSLFLSFSLFSMSISLCLSPPLASFSFSLSMPVRPQGVGVLCSCLLASLSEHQSMDHFPNPLTHKEPHFVWSPRSDALLGRFTTACVIAKRLGCLRWLAHAAGHGCFLSASTCRRAAPFVGKPLASLTSFEKLAIASPEPQLSFLSVSTRVFRPAGRHMPRITHACTCTYVA